ncbi:hypothetical protein GGF42_006841 [Coemansia sp. RSA 2424]|nr:hypothetical protein GGF42_006841 [Coemansia sp. RSA 2424]
MPSPSSPESAASGPPSPSPPTSPSLSAGSLVSSSPVAQVAYEQVGLGLNDSCNYYTIDPLDCTLSKSGGCFPGSYVPVISDPAQPLYLWTNVVCTLGAPESICAAAVSACAPIAALEESDDSSPFAIRSMDDLLLELGVADTMPIADSAIPEELLLPPPTIPMLGADADVLSLREIDELIEQLGYSYAAGCIGSFDYCGWPKRKSRTLDTPAKLDIAALIGGLRCVADIVAATNVYSLAVATATSSGDEAFASPAVDPAATFAELGRAGALASLLPLASTLNIDLIVRQLGDVGIATKAVPLPQAKRPVPRLDVVELIVALGRIIAPEFPCSTGEDEEPLVLLPNIAKTVESLGSPIDVVRAALMQATTTATLSLAKGLMRTPEPGAAVSLAGLGGVYTSEWLVHDMEQVCMVSEQALLNTPTSFSFLEFPPIPLQSGLSALGESRMSAELAGTGMDVDEAIVDRRSRSSSMSLEHPDGTQYINRLIAALRIPPIVVSRPFLGPRRNMLFPRLC